MLRMQKIVLLLLSANLQLIHGRLSKNLSLDLETASRLAGLPLNCMHTEYPNKLSQTLNSEADLLPPSVLHPVFYGCFDWHSAVHGHWLLVKVGNLFPQSEVAKNITRRLANQFTEQKIARELAYFQGPDGKLFERTYGWAWLLKLQEELELSQINEFKQFSTVLKPLADFIADLYVDFLPRMVYAVRAGEHQNIAFALSMTHEYSKLASNTSLVESIRNSTITFFLNDNTCPLGYEPSGYDFLSPCLQEAELMTRILEDRLEFTAWLEQFLPQLFMEEFILEPGEVGDRTDGKLVHLDGLNFSRAWALYNIANKITDPTMASRLIQIGDNHIVKSMDNVVGSDYAGSHWLASFLVYALEVRARLPGNLIKQ